ncbi:MAG TPA: hypothetical protein VIJ07_22255 [Dermatophilaceae bacterium]
MGNIMQETSTADMTRMNEHLRVVWRHLVAILDGQREHATEYLPGRYAWAEAATTVQRRIWVSSEVMTAAMA